MKKLLLLSLFVSLPTFAQTHEGFWLFYDLKLKEKFLLNLTDPMRGHQRISIRAGGALGGRYFKSDDYGNYGNYKVIVNRQDFQFTDETGSPVYMSGQFNADFTELSGRFNDGSRFVASKQKVLSAFDKPAIYQVVYNGGELGKEGDEYCQKVRDTYKNRKIKYSVKLTCVDTGGVGGARSQYYRELSGPSKSTAQAANWLFRPNTFIDYEQCTEAMQKVRDENKCWDE